ncbi:MAG: hypothetical protein U0625_00710 [Phycisphaerales bacterium]
MKHLIRTSAIALVAAHAIAGEASASFETYSIRSQWRAAVGPTTYRDAVGSGVVPGQQVNPEIWADVGVHLVSSGTLVGVTSSIGPAIKSPLGSSFWIEFDQPITALFWQVQTAFGFVRFYNGNEIIGFVADSGGAGFGLGAVSTIPFNRIQLSNGQLASYVWSLEWGAPVPAPGVGAVLAAGALARGGRRRRD